MSENTLSVLLWLPFLVVALVTSLIYGIGGKNRGFWRALFGLGAVVLASLLSIPVSRFFAKRMAPIVLNDASAQAADAITNQVLSGAMGSILSVVIFGLVMLVLTIVLRQLAFRIYADSFEPYEDWEFTGGLAVGVVAALLFTVLWLSPVYSTLSTYTPVVQKVARLTAAEEADLQMIEDYSAVIEKNPVVRVSGSAPMSFVYGEVSKFYVNDAAVNVPDLVDTMDELMGLCYALENSTNDEERRLLCIDIAVLVRDEVIEQDWLYDLMQELIREARSELNGQMGELDANERMIVESLFSIFDIPQGVFEDNCRNILDFSIYVLEEDLLGALEAEDLNTLRQAGFMSKFGWLMNSTEQAVQLKRLMIADMLYGPYFNDIQSVWQYLDKYNVHMITDSYKQEKEAEAFMMYLTGNSMGTEIFVTNHPTMGKVAWKELQYYR